MGNKGNKKRIRAESEEEDEDEEEFTDEDVPDEDEQGEGSTPAEKRPVIYNVEALHEKLEDICWTSNVGWEETLTISHEAATEIGNVEDDLEREVAFYNQALSASTTAIQRFEAAGTPWLRPPDFYAEMVKSDVHMNKVKEQLMYEQKQIEETEQRRKQRESKLYQKSMQAEKLKDRARDKKSAIESISKLRKQRENSGFAGEVDFDAAINNMGKKPKLGDRFQKGGAPVNKKKAVKDKKYGFGGSKRAGKQNDAYSSASIDGFKGGKKLGVKGGVAKKVAKGGKAQRPGKQRRQNMKGAKGGKSH